MSAMNLMGRINTTRILRDDMVCKEVEEVLGSMDAMNYMIDSRRSRSSRMG